jgi:bcr-type benzoyl-CoA reductase subunit C
MIATATTPDARTALLDACARALDHPGACLREWKQRHPAAHVVGYFPTYVPTELIYACGALPTGLWGGSIAVSRANAYIQQFTCSIVRSTTEYALHGAFDQLDAVLFPPICDSAKLVASIWALNFSERFMVDMVTLPERLDSDASVAYLAAELRRVGATLAQKLGVTIDDGALACAIDRCNRLRASQQAFCSRRATLEATMPLAHAAAVLKAGTLMHADDYLPLLDAFLAELTSDARSRRSKIPVVVSGLACQLPHPDFLALFDEAGFAVVGDDLLLGMCGGVAVATGGDPYLALARAFTQGPPLATRHHDTIHRHEFILDQWQRGAARGVVFLVPKFCEPEWFDLRYLKAEMEKRGIPNLVLDFDEDPTGFGPVLTRLEAFAEILM